MLVEEDGKHNPALDCLALLLLLGSIYKYSSVSKVGGEWDRHMSSPAEIIVPLTAGAFNAYKRYFGYEDISDFNYYSDVEHSKQKLLNSFYALLFKHYLVMLYESY